MSWEEHTVGACRLILGDCREVLPSLGTVEVLITDPPYGVLVPGRDARGGRHGLAKTSYASYQDTYEHFCTQIVPALVLSLAMVKRGAVFTGPHLQEQPKATAIGGVYLPAGSGRHPWGFKTFLPVLFYGTAPNLHRGAHPNTLQSSARAEKTGHPTPKPLAWMSWLVGLASLPGETILDPFAGVFTTGLACQRLGRPFIGIEIERRYFDIGCARLEAAAAAQGALCPTS